MWETEMPRAAGFDGRAGRLCLTAWRRDPRRSRLQLVAAVRAFSGRHKLEAGLAVAGVLLGLTVWFVWPKSEEFGVAIVLAAPWAFLMSVAVTEPAHRRDSAAARAQEERRAAEVAFAQSRVAAVAERLFPDFLIEVATVCPPTMCAPESELVRPERLIEVLRADGPIRAEDPVGAIDKVTSGTERRIASFLRSTSPYLADLPQVNRRVVDELLQAAADIAESAYWIHYYVRLASQRRGRELLTWGSSLSHSYGAFDVAAKRWVSTARVLVDLVNEGQVGTTVHASNGRP